MDEQNVISALDGILVAIGPSNSVSERQIIHEFDEFMGRKGILNEYLNEKRLTLSQYLASTKRYMNCNGGQWRMIIDEKSKDLAASVSDRKKGKKPRGSSSGVRGRGAAIPARRPLVDSHRNGNFRGNRGSLGHGHAFRAPPSMPNNPPQFLPNRSYNAPQDFSNQLPLTRNSIAPKPIDPNRNTANLNSSSYNEPINNYHSSSYDRPLPRTRSPPTVVRRSPDRSGYHSYRSPVHSPVRNSYRDYDRGSRTYDNEPTNYRRDNGGRYDDDPRYSRRGHSPVRNRRSPSPRRPYSPPPADRYNRDTRDFHVDYDRKTDRSNNDYTRNQRYNEYPSTYRNEYPPRPDSGASSYSQQSDTSVNDAPVTSTPQMDELAKKFNAVDISRPTSALGSVKDEKTGKKCAKAIKSFMKSTTRQVLLEELGNEVRKVSTFSDYSNEKMERYIAELKNKYPEILHRLKINRDKSGYKWIERSEAIPSEETTSYEADSEKNELYYQITDIVNSINTSKFRITEVVTRLVQETNATRNQIFSKLTFILFVENKGKYKYKEGDNDVVIRVGVSDDADSHDFTAPLVHKIFDSSYSRCMEVEVCRFLKFERFGVRLVEYLDEYEKMEREIQDLMLDDSIPDAPAGGWQPKHGCLTKVADSRSLTKWVRGVIIRTEKLFFRVYLMDIGQWSLLKQECLRVLPVEYRSIPPYCIPCSLSATEEQIDELVELRRKEQISPSTKKKFIEILDNYEVIDGVKVFFVNLFLETISGAPRNILD
uniref:Tudor domain-containing protein n=1 Tax=Caenorhabditis tropicalis TaxID=1561998 RepID=A0A1I7UL49_9PELO